MVKEVSITFLSWDLSSLYSPVSFTIPVPVAAVETCIKIVIKLVNWPSMATPAGPVKTAKTFAEIKVATIFIKVEIEVNEETFINCEFSRNLIFAFNRFGMY